MAVTVLNLGLHIFFTKSNSQTILGLSLGEPKSPREDS